MQADRSDLASRALELVLDVGLRRRIVDSRTAELAEPDGEWTTWSIALRRSSPTPHQIEVDARGAPTAGVLYVVPRASEHLLSRAMTTTTIAFVAMDTQTVGFNRRLWTPPSLHISATLPPINKRKPWARLAVMRVLTLASAPMTQDEIARACGVSQAAVSQSLSTLAEQVTRASRGWEPTAPDRLWEDFMSRYPGPGGLASYWASLASPEEQLRRCAQAAGSRRIVISGDWAADEYAPWRRPSKIIVLAESQADLESVHFGASDAINSSIEWRVAADKTIMNTAEWYRAERRQEVDSPSSGADFRYADPMVAAWDMARGRGTDIPDAVAALRQHTLGYSR